MEEIINEIKKVYANREDLIEIIEDLSGGSLISYWASRFLNEEYGNNQHLASELYKIALENTENFDDIYTIAKDVLTFNKEWSIEIIKKALEKAKTSEEYSTFIFIIARNNLLNDKAWGRNVAKKALETAKNVDDYTNLARDINSTLDDEEWAKEVISQAAEIFNNSADMFTIAHATMPYDEEWRKQFYEKAKNLAVEQEDIRTLIDIGEDATGGTCDCEDLGREIVDLAKGMLKTGYYCDLYNYIKNYLEDDILAEEFKNDYYDEMKNDNDELENCEELFGENDSHADVDEIDFDDLPDEKNVIEFSLNFEIYESDDDNMDENGNFTDQVKELIYEIVKDFISEFNENIEGHTEKKILVLDEDNDKLYELDEGLKKIQLSTVKLYIVVTKLIPKDILNNIFLDMSNYAFYSVFRDEDSDDLITQGYEEGEYNTGYFAPSSGQPISEYINRNLDDSIVQYNRAKKILFND